MVQAQIEAIQGKGDWKGKFGTMYTFEITFNDGTVGEANSKTQEPPYKVGDEVYYEIKSDDQYGKKLKVSKNPPPAGRVPAVPTRQAKPGQGQANHPGHVLQGGRDGVGQPVQTQVFRATSPGDGKGRHRLG